jgi:hypothetical protein
MKWKEHKTMYISEEITAMGSGLNFTEVPQETALNTF